MVISIPDFRDKLRRSKRRFLALDYDGTLAPFRAERMEAHPLAGIPEVLESIARGTSLAVISGRPIAEIAALLNIGGAATLIGSHGFERMKPGGEVVVTRPAPHQLAGLRLAEEKAALLGFERELEVKVASVAFHTRKMAPRSAERAEELVRAQWTRLCAMDLECRKFDGGVEVRASGRNKGDVLLELLSELPPDTFSVFIGDDETDEDAFRAIRGQGTGIKVGNPGACTEATGFLLDCEAVRDFLEQWLSITSTGGRLENHGNSKTGRRF